MRACACAPRHPTQWIKGDTHTHTHVRAQNPKGSPHWSRDSLLATVSPEEIFIGAFVEVSVGHLDVLLLTAAAILRLLPQPHLQFTTGEVSNRRGQGTSSQPASGSSGPTTFCNRICSQQPAEFTTGGDKFTTGESLIRANNLQQCYPRCSTTSIGRQ